MPGDSFLHKLDPRTKLSIVGLAMIAIFLLDSPLEILAAGDAKIDNKKYKATFLTKAKMLTPDEVESMIGHKIGGVCPFGINEGVKTYLDESLKRFDTVFPAVGSSNSAVELTPNELEEYAQGFSGWVDVCKVVEE